MKHRLRAEGFVEFLNKCNCGNARPTRGACFKLRDMPLERMRKFLGMPTGYRVIFDNMASEKFVENCASAWYRVKRSLCSPKERKAYCYNERLLIRVPRAIELPGMIVPPQNIDLCRYSRLGFTEKIAVMRNGEYEPLANWDRTKFGELIEIK